MKSRNVTHKVIKALACDFAGGFFINTVKQLHNIGVVGNFKVNLGLLAVLLNFDIFAVVLADGYALVHNVRYFHLDIKHLGCKLGFLFLESLKLGSLLAYQLFHSLGFVSFALTHKHAYLLAYLITVGAKLVSAAVSIAFLIVKSN